MATAEWVSEIALHSAQSLSYKLREAFPAYYANFDAKWKRWKQAISSSAECVFSSSPSTWSSVPEFDALVALGPKVIPLVLGKMVADSTDAAPAYLYNRLETDPAYRVPDDSNREHQANGIIAKNFRRSRLVRNALLDWAEHCEMVAVRSSVAFRTEGDEYERLLGLGPSVIPQLMLKYHLDVNSRGQGGRGPGPGPMMAVSAYELLHEILWGYQTEQQSVCLGMQYELWAEWFEGKNYDEAPHYRRPQWQQGDGI